MLTLRPYRRCTPAFSTATPTVSRPKSFDIRPAPHADQDLVHRDVVMLPVGIDRQAFAVRLLCRP